MFGGNEGEIPVSDELELNGGTWGLKTQSHNQILYFYLRIVAGAVVSHL